MSEIPCLARSEFDSEAFGFPYYRVVEQDFARLRGEIAELVGMPGTFAIDAKAPAADVGATHRFLNAGFRKVCMQIHLRHDLAALPLRAEDVEVAGRLELPEETLRRHAANFVYDRFSLDPLLPAEGRRRLYFRWLSNSLAGAKKVAFAGRNLCTFSFKDSGAFIDLTSILDHRLGYGAKTVGTVLHEAKSAGMQAVRVVTECENTAAWSLYQKLGFHPAAYVSAFHFVRL